MKSEDSILVQMSGSYCSWLEILSTTQLYVILRKKHVLYEFTTAPVKVLLSIKTNLRTCNSACA